MIMMLNQSSSLHVSFVLRLIRIFEAYKCSTGCDRIRLFPASSSLYKREQVTFKLDTLQSSKLLTRGPTTASGCFAWYTQKYFRKPFNDNTVPMQFFGLILSSLFSPKVCNNIFLYQSKFFSSIRCANINVLVL